MSKTEVLNLVEKHHVLLNNLSEVVFTKQNALIKNDFEKLSVAISDEEKILASIEIINKELAKILQSLKEKYSAAAESFTITDFLEAASNELDSEYKTKLSAHLSEIKKLAEEIALENYLNMTIIQNSRNLLNEMVSVLVGKDRTIILDRKY